MPQPLLEGEIQETAHPVIEQLEAEIRMLRWDLSEARQETAQARRDTKAALNGLRRQLSPLYRALQSVFGDLDALGTDDVAPNTSPRVSAVWENWKSKLGIGPAKVIDALLLHKEMNTQQLAIATGYHRNTVPQYVSALHQAGLINKRDGKFSLKEL